MVIKPGLRFLHKHWLDHRGKPLVCEVIKVEGKFLWFATVNSDGSYGMEFRGRRLFFARDHYGKRAVKRKKSKKSE